MTSLGGKTKTEKTMYKVVRKIHTHLNVVDSVYKDDKLQFEQPNLNSKNRFNCKQFKCSNGKILNVGAWEWAN